MFRRRPIVKRYADVVRFSSSSISFFVSDYGKACRLKIVPFHSNVSISTGCIFINLYLAARRIPRLAGPLHQ